MGIISPLPPDELGHRLAETVPTLRGLTAGLEPAQWLHRPAEHEWSITEIICHLRDVDREVHLARLQSLIHEEQPFMPGVVPDSWAIERDYQAQDGPAALAALEVVRGELLALLQAADSATWERRGRHTFFGPTSFLELVCLILEHDILHLQQVREVLDSRP
jgi:hypothetical protein